MGKFGQILKMIAGGILVLFTSPCVMMMIHDILVGAENLGGALMVGTFALVCTLAGLYLGYSGITSLGDDDFVFDEELEREVLRLAHSRGGSLEPAELAMETELSLDQAGMVLEDMEVDGHARLDLEDDGNLQYTFPAFEDEDGDELSRKIEEVATAERAE